MKTGMEIPLIGVIVAALLVGLWNTWSGMQVDLSVSAVTATAAGQAAPDIVMMSGQWIVKAIVGTLIGGTVTAGAAALIVWGRGQMRKQAAEQKQWTAGPNANWGRSQAQPKPISEAELTRYWMMQQMGMGRGERGSPMPPVVRYQEGEDEPKIGF